MPKRFPNIALTPKEDGNPAVQLFGRRFFKDQTTLELLTEFLLLVTSKKSIDGNTFLDPLPSKDLLQGKWETHLEYLPKARLNLKLFSFFGASKLESRYPVHRKHLENLDKEIESRITCGDLRAENNPKTLEKLLLGFHGVGLERTWCAQTFLPVCKSLVARESIWPRNKMPSDWEEGLALFDFDKHDFYARGGELIYLNLCNALRTEPESINEWVNKNGLASFFTSDEKDPEILLKKLNQGLANLFSDSPEALDKIADLIDKGIEMDTSAETDKKWARCGWCPKETWPEGYLLAVEINRILKAKLDIIDRLDLLEKACSMHVLRYLLTQALRQLPGGNLQMFPDYRLVITSPTEQNGPVKKISGSTVRKTRKVLYDAIRAFDKTKGPKDFKKADDKYGLGLFVALAKRMDFILPKRGPGMRFVLNEKMVLLLLTTLMSGPRMTYERFKEAARIHYGMAFDDRAISEAAQWVRGSEMGFVKGNVDEWLKNMLEEAGALRHLSDACAIVENLTAPDCEEARQQ